MRLLVFQASKESLLEKLASAGIAYTEMSGMPEYPMAAGVTLQPSELSITGRLSLCLAISQWAQSAPNRFLHAELHGGTMIDLSKLPASAIQSLGDQLAFVAHIDIGSAA